VSIGENIRQLREKHKITQNTLAEALEVSPSTIGMYEQDRRRPKYEKLEAIADYFNVPMESLIKTDFTPGKTGIQIPVLGYVRAGIPIEAIEEILDYEEISQEMSRQGEYFALSIKGDSMEPKISNGDVVIVRKQSIVENGDIAVVLVNGNDATVKKFYRNENGIKLISTNPTYDPFFFSPQEVNSLPVTVIGKVVELRAKFL